MENPTNKDLPRLKAEEITSREGDTAKRDELYKLQFFTGKMNKPIEQDKLKKHPFAPNDVYYLPISYMEMILDQFFYSHWNTVNFKWELIINEIVASIELSVLHPFSNIWITRTGATAKKIMTDAIPESKKKDMTVNEVNQWHLDTLNKKPNALEMGGFASLKAECFKNACISLGQYLGRDVNREFVDAFEYTVRSTAQLIKKSRKQLTEAIGNIQDDELRKQYIEKITTAEANGNNTPEFYNSLLKEINNE